MAKQIKYVMYMQNEHEMFGITNAVDDRIYFSAQEEHFKNPPIKMTWVGCSADIRHQIDAFRQFISIDEVSDDLAEYEDDPALEQECLQGLLGGPSDWRLVTVSISTNTVCFILANSKRSFVDISIGPSFAGRSGGNLRMSFDVARYDAPPERYDVEYSSTWHTWGHKEDEGPQACFRIVEYRNGYKYRRYEFGSHSHAIKGIGCPCQIEEY